MCSVHSRAAAFSHYAVRASCNNPCVPHRFAITGAEDSTTRVWDLHAPSQLLDQSHAGKVHCMAASPDGNTALSVGADAAGMAWNVRDGSCRHTFKGHAAGVHWGCISSDARHILTASGDRMVNLWDCATGSCLATLPSELLCAWFLLQMCMCQPSSATIMSRIIAPARFCSAARQASPFGMQIDR